VDIPRDAITLDGGAIRIVHVQDGYDVYGGRCKDNGSVVNTPVGTRGWLGNPFPLAVWTRQQAIDLYRKVFFDRLRLHEEFKAAVEELAGERIACYCRHEDEDEPECHLDVIDSYLDYHQAVYGR
jgi:hypothetical protein